MIGKQIKSRMKEVGHTTRSLSVQTGLARNTVMKVTNDKNYEISALRLICEALSLEVRVDKPLNKVN